MVRVAGQCGEASTPGRMIVDVCIGRRKGSVLERPALLNRPVVVTPLGTKVCRPSETLLELLPVPRLPPFVKEDGSVVVDRGTRRW